MQRWLQFLFLLFAASAMAHVPETRCISGSPHLTGNLTQRTDAQHAWIELRLAEVRSLSGADFQVCCIARPPSQHCGGWTGFQTRRAHDVVPAADLEIGDTAGSVACATLEADAGGSPREINSGTGQRPTSGNRELLQRPDTATLSHGEIITYLLAANQTMAASYRYDPYGNTTYSSGSLAAANVYRFSSKELHLNSGLYSYGYRFYSPNWQRWPNRDPLGEWDGPNLYTYVGNNPINVVDPLGLSGWMDMRALPNYTGPSTLGNSQGPTMQDVEVLGTVASIFLEPLDWAMTGKEIYDDPTNPWSYAGIVPFVPSAAGKAGKKVCELTQLGYKGGKKWRDAMKLIEKGGDVDLKKLGFTPTKAEALDMLKEAGVDVNHPTMFRIQDAHGPPSTHTYPHINYPTPGGGKGTIRIQ